MTLGLTLVTTRHGLCCGLLQPIIPLVCAASWTDLIFSVAGEFVFWDEDLLVSFRPACIYSSPLNYSSPPLFSTIFVFGNVGLLQRTGPAADGPLSGRPGMLVSVWTLMASPFLRLRSGSISTLDLMVSCSSLGVLIPVGFCGSGWGIFWCSGPFELFSLYFGATLLLLLSIWFHLTK